MDNDAVTVLLADDHAVVRCGLRAVLQSDELAGIPAFALQSGDACKANPGTACRRRNTLA